MTRNTRKTILIKTRQKWTCTDQCYKNMQALCHTLNSNSHIVVLTLSARAVLGEYWPYGLDSMDRAKRCPYIAEKTKA